MRAGNFVSSASVPETRTSSEPPGAPRPPSASLASEPAARLVSVKSASTRYSGSVGNPRRACESAAPPPPGLGAAPSSVEVSDRLESGRSAGGWGEGAPPSRGMGRFTTGELRPARMPGSFSILARLPGTSSSCVAPPCAASAASGRVAGLGGSSRSPEELGRSSGEAGPVRAAATTATPPAVAGQEGGRGAKSSLSSWASGAAGTARSSGPPPPSLETMAPPALETVAPPALLEVSSRSLAWSLSSNVVAASSS